MSDIVFEQYKEALRRGHLAAIRGRLEHAVSAYEAAALIAPDRALPHASLGEVLARMGRHDAAERAYGAALQRAPGNEGALRGRAAARILLDRRLDAARDLEDLADVLERDGRLPEACDAACDALDLAESRSRRRTVERLAAVLSGVDGDAAAAAGARARSYFDPPQATPSGPGPAGQIAPEPITAAATQDDPSVDAVASAALPAPLPETTLDTVAGRIHAENLMEAGRLDEARSLLLAIAAADRAAGRLDAALDGCLTLMTIDPADPATQLELASIQMARGWMSQARDKVQLLGRLADLGADGSTPALVAAFARDHALESPALPGGG